ncbi:hypothetical protein DRN69_00635 [Candidatus Pacearchaeota archaeon]|nr:MAG: hypothetical protein DRN69_00635 [Candidatus Pacearchaeota archaeon]
MIYEIDLLKLDKAKHKLCPCLVKGDATNICPCDKFTKEGKCICGIFKLIVKNEDSDIKKHRRTRT